MHLNLSRGDLPQHPPTSMMVTDNGLIPAAEQGAPHKQPPSRTCWSLGDWAQASCQLQGRPLALPSTLGHARG